MRADRKPAGLGEQQSQVHMAGMSVLDGSPFPWIILLIHSWFKLTVEITFVNVNGAQTEDSNLVLFFSISFLQNLVLPYSCVCRPSCPSVSLSDCLYFNIKLSLSLLSDQPKSAATLFAVFERHFSPKIF